MSFGIFMFAAMLGLATLVICSVINGYIAPSSARSRAVVVVAVAGTLLSLAVVLLSLNFENFAHLRACMKYDHVVPVVYTAAPAVPIDKTKVISCTTYELDRTTYTTVLMAWNDTDKYSEIAEMEEK